jgi:hypothetical protein
VERWRDDPSTSCHTTTVLENDLAADAPRDACQLSWLAPDGGADGGTDRYRHKTSQQGEQGHGRLDAVDPPAQWVPADPRRRICIRTPQLTAPLLNGHHHLQLGLVRQQPTRRDAGGRPDFDELEQQSAAV